MKYKTWWKIGAVAALAAAAVSCESLTGGAHSHHANNLFAFLYPDKAGHIDQPAIPVLSLPLRVGVAFVPADQSARRGYPFTVDEGSFSEEKKMQLMKDVSSQFKSRPFVGSIELIPTLYLRPQGGFANLDQLKAMYGVDVMVLLSYDQVQFTDAGWLSLSYWTIVGA
jgi:rhombotail lipoprotein